MLRSWTKSKKEIQRHTEELFYTVELDANCKLKLCLSGVSGVNRSVGRSRSWSCMISV